MSFNPFSSFDFFAFLGIRPPTRCQLKVVFVISPTVSLVQVNVALVYAVTGLLALILIAVMINF